MVNTKIDVIITTYNGSKHIEKLLESIENQTYKDYSCYVIDDNSSDNTVAIIKENFSWVKLIEQYENVGPSINRNIAIKMGKSPYIITLDDDTYIKDPNWFKTALKIIESNNQIGQIATMIVSGYNNDLLLDCGSKNRGGIFHNLYKTEVLNKHLTSRPVLGACTAGSVIKRDVFNKIGGFDPKYYYLAEDLDLSLRVNLSGYNVVYIPELVVYHYESQSMRKRKELKDYLFIRNNTLSIIENFPVNFIFLTISNKLNELILKRLLSLNNINPLITQSRKTQNNIKIINLIKTVGFILANLPNIINKRKGVEKFRKRPRQYLVDLNNRVQKETQIHIPTKSVIFSITNKCNAKCPMCFVDDLNEPQHLLSLKEITEMFESFHELDNVVLSGGEPFLRPDIDEICISIFKISNATITIPTHGGKPDIIYKKVLNILSHGCNKLIIALSLDGMEEYHNKNRGLKDLFKKVLESYKKLVLLKDKFGSKLNIHVNTAITRENIEEMFELSDYIASRMPMAIWTFEPVRGSFNDENAITELSEKDWEALYKKTKIMHKRNGLTNYLQIRELFYYSIETLKRKTQIIDCAGGNEFISIDSNGGIAPCELLPSVTNIRDLNYNINKLLISDKWKSSVDNIMNKKCYCTHFCWLAESIDKQKGIFRKFYSKAYKIWAYRKFYKTNDCIAWPN